MRLLLDSHIVLGVLHREMSRYGQAITRAIQSPDNQKSVSAASLWEIAIKHRLGKLALQLPLTQTPNYLRSLGFKLLDIDHRHAIEGLRDLPTTRDPFDQLLLAQCQMENLLLVTADGALARHPLAWRAA